MAFLLFAFTELQKEKSANSLDHDYTLEAQKSKKTTTTI